MKNLKFGFATISIAALLALFALSLLWVDPTPDAQAAVITPIAQTGRGAESARLAQFFVAEAITADTRKCFDLSEYEILDLQYQVDATNANTTSVSLQQTNINPTSGPFNSANAIATVISTDANVMVQVPTFGRWNCVLADVTNSQPITFTIIAVAK